MDYGNLTMQQGEHSDKKYDHPVVQTSHGMIRGENRDGVLVFRGIPYGADCDGVHRFLPAKPAPFWDGVRDCTKNGPIAIQYGTSISGSADFGFYFSGGKPELFGCENEVQSENCLVLNVLTGGCDDKKRPVLVYLHGGGFATGSGTLVLGSDYMVKEEDIVVVGINHRLNVFGALYLGGLDPDYAESGTQGIGDCVLALEWVRDNISAFGGDPQKVTIMGESGGGGKVNDLLAMKEAKGLFRAAIVESGSLAPGSIDREEATRMAERLLQELFLEKKDVKKLTELPAKEILSAADRAGLLMAFSPIGDGVHLPENPDKRYWEEDPSLPLLVGASQEEQAAFIDPIEGELTRERLREILISEPQMKNRTFPKICVEKSVKDVSEKKLWSKGMRFEEKFVSGLTQENVDDFIDELRRISGKEEDYQHTYYQAVSMGGILGRGAYNQALEKAMKGEGAVYHYFITFRAPHPRFPNKRYAWHTADLPLQLRIVAYPSCEEISRKMAHAWAAFVRTGSPDTPALPWPAFTVDGKETMVVDEPFEVKKDPTRGYRELLGG